VLHISSHHPLANGPAHKPPVVGDRSIQRRVVPGRTVWSVLKRRPARRQREVSEPEVGEEANDADTALATAGTGASV
jgi:hypothetical protein